MLQEAKSPLTPPLPKGGTERHGFESPPLKKGDLGGFKNQQSQEIIGKYFKRQMNIYPGLISAWTN